MTEEGAQLLLAFLQDKTIVGLRYEEESGGIDLIFEDGSELELYCLPDGGFGFIELTAEEAAEQEQKQSE